MSSLCVESSRLEIHCDRLVELKRLVIQLDDFRFETLKYLCAHFLSSITVYRCLRDNFL